MFSLALQLENMRSPVELVRMCQVGALTRNASEPSPTDAGRGTLQDGKWHMVTLSSLYDGTRGYAMFIDGRLTAVLNGNQSYTGAQMSC